MVALSPLFASLFALASLAVAGPVVKIRSNGITVPIATHINVTGPSTFVKMEQERAKMLIRRGKAMSAFKAGVSQDAVNIPVTNILYSYTLQASIGTPGTSYTLIIDTGSANTWVGDSKAYTPTSSSVDTGATVNVPCGRGSFSGEEFTDTVDLGGGLVIQGQSIGVAKQSQGILKGVDGILGIGPVDLTSGTLSTGEQAPTIMENLAKAGTIPSNLIGIFYTTPTSTSDMNGELTFGGIDSSKISGSVNYVPITSTSPANKFWGINQTITYGSGRHSILANTAGILDTGTTLMMLATDAFQAYSSAVGGTVDQTTGLLKISDPSTLQSLFYQIGDVTYEFTAQAQQWPQALNSVVGGDPHSTYLIVGDLGRNSGRGYDFINGFTWLQHFYSVFDTDNKRVGIANLA